MVKLTKNLRPKNRIFISLKKQILFLIIAVFSHLTCKAIIKSKMDTTINHDTLLFKHKGSLIMEKIKIIYEVNISGEFIVTNKNLVFYPKKNKQYIKIINISLDSIESLTNSFYPILNKAIWIHTKDGNVFKVILNGKRKEFIKKVDGIIKNNHIGVQQNKKSYKIINNESNSTNCCIYIHGMSSLFYIPWKVNGFIKKSDTELIFTPTEYMQIIKTINIKWAAIKNIENPRVHKIIVEMNSGEKYIFILNYPKSIFY